MSKGSFRVINKLQRDRIDIIQPLLTTILTVYQSVHPDLLSLWVCGSVSTGNFVEGTSDVDVVGVAKNSISAEKHAKRGSLLEAIPCESYGVTFIDHTCTDINQLQQNQSDPFVARELFKLSTSGVKLWGKDATWTYEMDAVTTAISRIDRAALLLNKYREGNLITAFQRDEKLLVRSCAKATLRVLSSITLLKGAPLQLSYVELRPQIATHAPELIDIYEKTLDYLGPSISGLGAEESLSHLESVLRLAQKYR